jgi:inosose dehydratase
MKKQADGREVRMKLGHQTNSRGVVGSPVGVTSIKDLFYLASGDMDTAVREIAEAGYQGVEFFDGNLLQYPGGPPALKSLLDGLGMRLVAVYSGANFIFPEILGEELWRVEKAAAAAAGLGAEHLVVGGGARRAGGTEQRDYRLLGEGLDRVAGIAEKHGLAASFHPHLGTCVESPEEVENALRGSNIFLCPDTAHLTAGGSDLPRLIRRYAGRIRYVHLKDYVPEPFGFVPLGEGRLDLEAVAGALRDIDYDGWITVETDGYPGDPRESAAVSMRRVKKLFPGG